MVIYKYVLSHGENIISMPGDSSALAVAEQDNRVVLWVLHQSNGVAKKRSFLVVHTGEDFNDAYYTYIGTVQKQSGIVKHVFERIGNK